MLSGSFSTRDVLRLTGASARQLQWWDEHRLVIPARAGRNRLYSPSDLADILVILQLRRRHISLQQVRRVLRFLKRELGARLADLVSSETEAPLSDYQLLNYHLLIDGRRLYLQTDRRQIFDLLRNSDQAVFVVSLSDTVKTLRVANGMLSEMEQPIVKKPPMKAAGAQGVTSKAAREESSKERRDRPGRVRKSA